MRGKTKGPRLFISAAIHGDEIVGTEIIRRLLVRPELKEIKGMLIAAPIVNIFGFNNKSRYLPDRRDLNRSFPGKKNGPLAAQLANLFMKEIVAKCTHGIDLHSGGRDRKNLPQIRAFIDDPETKRLALAFGTPVVIHSKVRDGSLREAARKKKIPMLLFEGGEALRIDEKTVKMGVQGCLSVMRSIGMIKGKKTRNKTHIAKGSSWIRAPHSGTVNSMKRLGTTVRKGQTIATISDPLGSEKIKVIAPRNGIIIGKTELPLVNKGDAMFHIATSEALKIEKSPLFDTVIGTL
ncbi:MAG: succinylglutamate desuccinylase [Bdellovibrionaceae bacterium]|nr:succinylglutamate desuccinylase [Pseudobdellovibrionaceae bacterium]